MPTRRVSLSDELAELREEIPDGATPAEAATIIAESETQLKSIPKKNFGIQDQETLALLMTGFLIAATRMLSRKMLGTPEGQMQDNEVQQITGAMARIILRHAPKGAAPGDVTDAVTILFASATYALQLYDLGDRLRSERAHLAGQPPQPVILTPPIPAMTNGVPAPGTWTQADIRKVEQS